MEIKIKNEKEKGDKIYFDLFFDGVKIKNCFVEKGKEDDWMLRLPTKKKGDRVEQIIWLDELTFKKACKFVRNHF